MSDSGANPATEAALVHFIAKLVNPVFIRPPFVQNPRQRHTGPEISSDAQVPGVLGIRLRRPLRAQGPETVMTLAPNDMAFSTAYCATLPEPETLTLRPSNELARVLSISSAK